MGLENSTLYSKGEWKKGIPFKASFDFYPANKGSSYDVFTGKASNPRKTSTTYDVMVKVRRDRTAELRDWQPYLDVAREAGDMASEFNRSHNSTSRKTLKFVRPVKVIIDELASLIMFFTRIIFRFDKVLRENEAVIFEERLRGNFQIFVSDEGKPLQYDVELLEAFSHFSYHQSGGNIVITRLQGVATGNKYRLTNPVIHSKSGQFGSQDKGPDGIQAFFRTHECTDLCRELLSPYLGNGSTGSDPPPYSE